MSEAAPTNELQQQIAYWLLYAETKPPDADVFLEGVRIGHKMCAKDLEAILSRASQPRGIQADGSWICPTCHDPNCGSDSTPALSRASGPERREKVHETMGYESEYMRGRREMREEIASGDAPNPAPTPVLGTAPDADAK